MLDKLGFLIGSEVGEFSFVPTGLPNLDLLFGTGGIPVGHVTTIFGQSGVTKSSLCYSILDQTKKRGGVPVLFDQEFNFDAGRHIKFGWDPKAVFVKQDVPLERLVQNLTEVIERVSSLKGYKFSTIVIDSFSATLSTGEVSSGVPGVGVHSRFARYLFRSLMGTLKRCKAALIFVCQETSKIGVTFGATYTFLSRQALETNSFLCLRLQRRSTIKDGAGGLEVKATVLKNKFARPFVDTTYRFLFDKGFDYFDSLLKAALMLGLFTQKGGWLLMDSGGKDPFKFQKSSFASKLAEPEFKSKFEKAFNSALQNLGLGREMQHDVT